MAAPTNPAIDNIRLTSSVLDAHLQNVRSKLPPAVGAACLPDSTSAVLRNLVLAMAALNAFLFLGALFSTGVRFMGYSALLIASASCAHAACAAMVLGSHVAETVGSLGLLKLAAILRGTSTRYGSDAYAHGALFGSTLAVAAILRVASSYYGGVAECISSAASESITGAQNLTGGYANVDGFDAGPYAACGASVSASVGLVSFLSGMLFWLDVVFAAVLYSKKQELLSGDVGPSNQYDEIGGHDINGGGFAGDYPSSAGVTTMHV